MRLIEKTSPEANEITKAEAYWENLSGHQLGGITQEYHELAETPVTDADPLAQLCANIETLSDLQNRLSFVMREVKYLMKV